MMFQYWACLNFQSCWQVPCKTCKVALQEVKVSRAFYLSQSMDSIQKLIFKLSTSSEITIDYRLDAFLRHSID